jgi:hypothetical protein
MRRIPDEPYPFLNVPISSSHLEELRCRMPELRKQQAIEAELQSLEMTTIDQTRDLRLVETLA